MACLVEAARRSADGVVGMFVVGLKVMFELQNPEHAQCRLTALPPGLITSLSVIHDNNHQTEEHPHLWMSSPAKFRLFFELKATCFQPRSAFIL